MSGNLLRLVLLVSCAHAMVHVYELSLPSVEQEIAYEYFGADEAKGKSYTGTLSNVWRFLWGIGALLAGWLVDRFGSKPMLAIYLLGCCVTCIFASMSNSQAQLLLAMILMGASAAIYHPAGLALISHETSADSRPRALGVHGIFGSLGIGSAPMLAWLLVTSGFSWRDYYWALAVPGGTLGLVFFFASLRKQIPERTKVESDHSKQEQDNAQWGCFFVLVGVAASQGFVYSAFLSFLPRYLSGWDSSWLGGTSVQAGKLFAAGVLLLGCLGQYAAGRIARPKLLEAQLVAIVLGNVPFLAWMAWATGWDRLVAPAMFAVVHFMQQPVYNSLVSKYSPRRRRSLCYGFSFAMAFGLGSFGAGFAGRLQSDFAVYGSLAIVAALGGAVAIVLTFQNANSNDAKLDT